MVTYYQSVQTSIIPVSLVKRVVECTLRCAKKKVTCDVSVHMIGERRMRSMNTLHRGKTYVTDVLSFPTDDTQDIGDIFLCTAQIIRQSKKFQVSPKEECVRMLVHGTLHLLGYDHIKPSEASRMFSLQERIVSQCM
jgi:probable rRNA maturation factor